MPLMTVLGGRCGGKTLDAWAALQKRAAALGLPIVCTRCRELLPDPAASPPYLGCPQCGAYAFGLMSDCDSQDAAQRV